MTRRSGSTPQDAALAAFVALVHDAPLTAFVKDPNSVYLYANRYLRTTLADQVGPEWAGRTDDEIWPPAIAISPAAAAPATMLDPRSGADMQRSPHHRETRGRSKAAMPRFSPDPAGGPSW